MRNVRDTAGWIQGTPSRLRTEPRALASGFAVLALALVPLLVPAAKGAVRSVEIGGRGVILDGQALGGAGAYERIAGKVRFALEPKLAANRMVRDLEFAAANAAGEIECAADFYMLKPVDGAKGNGTLLFAVSNRGGKGMLGHFDFRAPPPPNSATSGSWSKATRWCGWAGSGTCPPPLATLCIFPRRTSARTRCPPTDWCGRNSPPTARQHGSRWEIATRTPSPWPVRWRCPWATRRATARPSLPPSGAWAQTGNRWRWRAVSSPDKIYEFVYQGKDPVVAGTGLAAVRDWVSFLKYGGAETALADVHRAVRRAVGFGVSQGGRFLRQFLYDGFNADEQGRMVFDGMWADVAGAGRGSFNFRYAQPSRDGWPLLNVFYPTDVFPFTDAIQTNPGADRRTGCWPGRGPLSGSQGFLHQRLVGVLGTCGGAYPRERGRPGRRLARARYALLFPGGRAAHARLAAAGQAGHAVPAEPGGPASHRARVAGGHAGVAEGRNRAAAIGVFAVGSGPVDAP